jgi:hypothetical protein
MKALFVDTAGWMACADAADPAHAGACKARDAALKQGRVLVTTDYVVDELLTLVRVRLGLPAAAAWWRQVDASPRLRWEWIDPPRAEKARDAFFHHGDKAWSFTDCTSFVVMHELKLSEALTTDRHFTQMGFQVVPARAARRRR